MDSESENVDSFLTKMKCAFCGSEKYTNDNLRLSKTLDNQLKRWRREEERIIKLLLLGIGESGKSTLTKQMRIIHIGDYTDSERIENVPDIRRNIKEAMQTIVGAMTHLDIPLANTELINSLDYVRSEVSKSDFTYTQGFYEHLLRLWEDKGIQTCFHRSNEYQLFDCAKYFLDRIHIVRQENYIPSDQDLLRCRVMTNTIQRIDFKAVDGKTPVSFSVFDVGGQQGERRKWIQVFDSVTAILFVLDCSCFDLTLREDTTRNRFLEAMETFEQVWNNKYLQHTPVVLFLNKIDLLEEKINQGRSLQHLIDSLDPNHHYYELLERFRGFDLSKGDKIKDGERQEFIEAFPRSDPAVSETASSPTSPKSGKLKGNRKKSSSPSVYRDDINDEVIRTAIFIKRTFMSLVQCPIHVCERGFPHKRHSCEFYFTCAVDTQTIRKVLDGCRTLIIRQVLDKWGM